MTAFMEGIEDQGFKTVKQLLENYLLEIDHSDRTMNVKEFTDMVESCQRGFNRVADKDMGKKAFLQWKNATVKGEPVTNEEVIKNVKQENGDNSQKSKKGKK
eukprot:11289513-Ditylum_brightwellii.AAC.1